MNALLAKTTNNPQTTPDGGVHTVRLAIDENVSNWSTTPTAHVRDLVAAGIKPAGLAVYFAIADRQMTAKGQYFRSNEKLAEETGVSAYWVKRQLRELKKLGYLKIWYIKGGRRMRILSYPQAGNSVTPTKVTQLPTDKENNIKKTTQTEVCVFSDSLLLQREEKESFWGESLEKLEATHGRDAVLRGLAVYDSHDPKTIDNPVGFLTKAIKEKWEPIKKKKKKLEPVYWSEAEYLKGCK